MANQDTNTVKIFLFNMTSGKLSFTHNEFNIPSPNFVCTQQLAGLRPHVGRRDLERVPARGTSGRTSVSDTMTPRYEEDEDYYIENRDIPDGRSSLFKPSRL